MSCRGMVATGRSQTSSQALSCSNISGMHAVRLIHRRLPPLLRAHRPEKFALLCTSAAKTPPTGERPTKVVGLGSVGLDYLAQVMTFPKPDEKLRTKQMEVRHSKSCRGTRFVRVFEAQRIMPVATLRVCTDAWWRQLCERFDSCSASGAGNPPRQQGRR